MPWLWALVRGQPRRFYRATGRPVALAVLPLEERITPVAYSQIEPPDWSFFAYAGGFAGGVNVSSADVTGDGVADLVTAAGPGGGPHVKVFDRRTNQVVREWMAYDPGFRGGANVAVGDVTGDGRADVITGAGPGGGPHVRVFDGVTNEVVREFMAFDDGFRGGVTVAVGDVTGDGTADLVVGAGPGGGPHVKVFDGRTMAVSFEFFAYAPWFPGGVNVAVGDATGDGRADVITGAGFGGGPHVKVFAGVNGAETIDLFAYDSLFRGGVSVAVADVNADGKADVITGAGPSGGPHVRVLDATALGRQYPDKKIREEALLADFFAFDGGFRGGVNVAVGDLIGDGQPELVAAAGPGGGPHVKAFAADGLSSSGNFDTDLAGWETNVVGGTDGGKGGLTVADGVLTMREGDSFRVGLSKAFTVPAAPTAVRVTYDLPEFDTASLDRIKDAFEVAVVGADGAPLALPVAPRRDASFNWTEQIDPIAGADATRTTGAIGGTVTVNLSALPADTAAKLVLRLVNDDTDQGTSIRIRRVDFVAATGTAPAGTTPPPDRVTVAAPDLAALADVTPSARLDYGRTTLTDEKTILTTDVSVRNAGTYALAGRVVVALGNLSDPSVGVLDPDGYTADGRPYFDLTPELNGTVLRPGRTSAARTLRFTNPNRERFTFDTQVLAGLDRDPVFTTEPVTLVQAGRAYQYPARAADPDGQALTYSLAGGPAGMTVNSTTGDVSWATAANAVGSHAVRLRVTDTVGGTAEQRFTVTVKQDVPNRPPVITGTPPTDATVAGAWEVNTLRTGPDATGIAVADFGTGKQSLVSVNAGDQTLSVSGGTGNGKFNPTNTQRVGEPVPSGRLFRTGTEVNVGLPPSVLSGDYQSLTGFAQGDVNGDGTPDLVTAAFTRVYNSATPGGYTRSNFVSVAVSGADGTFADPLILPVVTTTDGNEENYATGSVAVKDFDGDGKADILALYGNGAEGTASGPNQFLFWKGSGTGTFAAVQKADTGTYLAQFQAADLNADGKLDLIGVRTSYSQAGVLFGTGTGTFGPYTEFANVPGAGFYNPFAVGDVDGANGPDVVLTSYFNQQLLVFRNNGSGTLTPSATLNTAVTGGNGQPFAVSVGDFTGDGKADVVFAARSNATGGGAVGLFKGTGDGVNFTYADANPGGFIAQTPYQFTTQPPVDLNGDGKLDFVLGHADGYRGIEVGLNRGDGTFAFTTYQVAGDPSGTSANSGIEHGVLIGDYNRDGTLDLAAYLSRDRSYYPRSAVTVLFADAPGVFNSPRAVPVTDRAIYGGGPNLTLIGDVNNDGNPDLVAGDNAHFYTSLGAGDGTFGPPLLATPYYNTPTDGFLTDLNRDGKLDLVWTGSLNGQNQNPGYVAALGNGDGTFTITYTQDSGNFYGASVITPGDFNGDGYTDFAAFHPAIYAPGTGTFLDGFYDVFLYQPAAAGTFARSYHKVIPVGPADDDGTRRSFTAGDFDGDGRLDLVSVFPRVNTTPMQMLFFKGNGDGTFLDPTGTPVFATNADSQFPKWMAAGDLNGDGTLDLVMTSAYNRLAVFLGTGTGTFGTPTEYVAGTTFTTNRQAYLTDVDGDGRLDFVGIDNRYGSIGNHMIAVRHGRGDGTFGPEELYNSPGTINHLGVGDVDRDGVPDVVASTSFYGGGYSVVFTGVKPGLTAVTTGDVTGDGKKDVIATNFANNRVKVLAGNGKDTFTRRTDILVGRGPVAVAALDFDADGKLDVVTANRSGKSVTVLRNAGGGTFTRTDVAVGSTPAALAVGDLTGDGNPDLLVADDGTNAGYLLVNTGSGFAAPVPIPLGDKPNAVAIADATGDGKPDAVFTLPGSKRVMVLPGNGNGTFGLPVYVNLSSAPGGVAAADFNQDGKTDLAVTLPADGMAAVVFARGSGLFARPQVIRVGKDPTAIVTQDVDGDGRPDLLVANQGDGTASVVLNKFDPTKLYRYTVTAFDPDGDPLAFDLPNAPGGMVLNPTTGEIVWAPTADQLGTNPVTVQVSDGRGGTATQSFGIAVTPTRTNAGPVFTSAATTALDSSAAFSYPAKAVDSDGDTLRYRLVSGPAGATIDPLTGVVNWDPRNTGLRMNDGVDTSSTGQVVIPDAPSLRPASLTAEGWFRFDNTTLNQLLINKHGPNGDFFYPYSFALRYQYGLLHAQVGGQDALGNNVNRSADIAWTPVAGRWYHVAMAFDDATGRLALLLDGKTVATQTVNGHITYDNTPVRVGAYENGGDGLIGAASNVRLWGVARTQGEIQANLAADVAPTAPGLLADLRFRDGDAVTMRDSSVNGNNGRRGGSQFPVPVPGMADPQTRTFTVRVEDGKGGFDLQTFTVNVVPPMRSAITGTVAQAGGPLGGWAVFVDANGNGYRDGGEASATTAANGTYSLPNLLAGDYRLSVELRTGFVTPAARTVTVAAFADAVADFAVTPLPPGQIRGTVTATGPAVPGWVVFLDGNGNTVRDDGETTATTDATGNYAFTGLTAGAYAVRFDAPSGWKATAPVNGRTVTLAANGTSTGNDFTIAPVDAAGGGRPRFVTTPGTAVVARTPFRYVAAALDPAGRPLAYSLALAPAGMAIDPTTGLMAWTPTFAQVGAQQVIVKVSNDAGGIDLQAFTVTVGSPNTTPVITSTPRGGALAGVPFRYDVFAQDAEQTALAFTFDTAPAGATIDPTTGRIAWTPTTGQLGPQTFVVVVQDGAGGETRQAFTVTVAAAGANTAPTITALPRLTARAAIPYSGRITATDPDGDQLMFTLTGGPAGLTLSPDGLISWTPTAAQLGTHTVDVSVSDGRGGTDSRTFGIAVGNTLSNAAPVVTSTPPAVATADGLFAYTLATTDADGDPVAFRLLTAPAGMSLDAVRGTLRWQPARDQLGPATVSVRAYDPFGGETTQTFTVTVRGADGPPVITSVPPTEAAVGTTFLYSVRATDLEGDPLTFALLEAPVGMTIHPVTGELSWTPTAGQVGTPAVVIQVSDGRGGFTTQGFAVRVLAAPPNRPPAFDTDPPLFASVGSPYTFTAVATDPDGQPVRYEFRTGPAGMTVDAATGEVRWTPDAGQESTQVVTVAAFDVGGAAGLLSFEVSVLAANTPPTVTGTAPTFAIAGGTYRYDVTAADADLDPLTYTLVNAPVGMTVDAFGRITWRPAVADIGQHTTTVRVSDPRGGTAEQTFALNVRADTSAPRVVVIPGRPVVRATDNDTSARFNLTPDNPSNVVRVAATDDVGVVGLTVTANGKAVVPDERGMLTFHFQDWGFGAVRIVATATDAAGNVGTGSKAFAFAPYGFDPDGDTRDPGTLGNTTAVITSPTAGEQTGGFVTVRGSATSNDFTGYTLSFRRADQNTYTAIATGTAKVADGVLGRWDTSLLENDEYVLRLEETDEIFGTTVHEVGVGVSGHLKLGNFRLSFADLTIPVAGIPITLARTYDTLRADRDGDLGFGWRLEYRNTNLQVGLPKSGLEDLGIYTAFKPGTKVYLSLPGGERQGFTFTPDLRALPSFGGDPLVIATPRFTPDQGVTSTLSVGSGSVILNQFNELTTLGGLPWNPAAPDFGGGYTLTQQDGTRFFIDGTTGLMQTATDRNDNRLTFGDGGITSSSGGVGVTFDRDAKGRIVGVTDPAGNKVRYAYDARGDLVSVTDRTGNVTRFVYRTDRPHYLDSIADPLGRTGARTEYGPDGRLVGTIDAGGNRVSVSYDPDNSLMTTRDALGRPTVTEYDPRGNVVATMNALGGVTRTSYDAADRAVSVTDPLGNTRRYAYDAAGNVVAETDPLGNVTRAGYNAAGDQVSATDALGHTVAMRYDGRGNLIGQTDAAGGVTTYTVDGSGTMTAATFADGTGVTMTTDAAGRTVRTVDVLGRVTESDFDAVGNVVATRQVVSGPNGPRLLTTVVAYDADGNAVAETDPLGRTTRTEYDSAGRRTATVGPDGGRRVVRFDGRGQPLGQTGTDGSATGVTVDAAGQVVARTDEAGRVTRFVYDALGRAVETIFPDDTPGDPTDTPRTRTEYDAAGRVTAGVDELGRRTTFEYDAAGRQVVRRDPLGGEWRTEYDAAGRVVRATDPLGVAVRYEYDDLGRRTRVRFADGTALTTEYDVAGNVVAETDQEGRTTRYGYDAGGRLTTVTDALGAITRYEYDEQDLLVRQTDANGHVVRYEYDDLGRRVAEVRPLGQRATTTYDLRGRVAATTDFNGTVTTYEYDAADRLTARRYADGTADEFTFTPTGRLATERNAGGTTTYGYDARDRLTARTGPDGRTVTYTYNAAGERVGTGSPAGAIGYTYDAAGRLAAVTDPDGGVTRYTYDPAGNRTRTDLPNGTTERREYDGLHRLTAVETLAPSGAVLARSVYTRDATGRVASASETGGRAVTYTYDATYRLTAEAITDPAGGDRRIDYTYDPVGNRLTRVDSVGGSAAYTYDANDRLMRVVEAGVTTDFTYDANGNVLTRLEGGRLTRYDWTAGGLLRRVTDVAAATVVEYRYDPSGNRAAQVVNGAETRYLVDVNREHPQVLEEYTATGVATADYVTGLELISQSAGGARTYFGRDGGGNTRLLTTAAGAVTATYTYDAYGRTLAATGGGTAFQYRGEQRDPATGLDFLRARYLDVNLGRFLSVDPYEGEPARPYTRTDYIYANADPVNGRDPSGRNTTSEQITVAGVLNTLSVTLTVGVIGYKVYASYKAGELSAIKFLTIVGYELAITYAGGAVAKGLGLAAGVLGAGLKPFLSQARNLPGFGNIVKLGVNTPAVRRAVAALGFAASQRASAPATAVNMVEVARTLPAVLETTARGKRTLTVFVNTAEGLATVNRFAAELAGRYTTVVVSSTVQGALSRGLSSTAGVAFDAFANAAMLEAAVARLLAFAGGNTGLALLGE